jgi:hypothetical protein
MEIRRSGTQFGCEEARHIDIVEYLYSLGYDAKKIKGNNYWFLSPLRKEKTASFKVDRKRNSWYDFGEGKGGNFIDFAILYYRCTVSELLAMLNGQFPLLSVSPAPVVTRDIQNKIIISEVIPLGHPALLHYCSSRCIDPKIAKAYCGQAYYSNNRKRYFAICFKNCEGGYELRNAYFKGSSSPKAITLIENGKSNLVVFEGFFDFLSYLILLPSWDFPAMDCLILNSLSFFDSALSVMDRYVEVHLFLDNNAAGRKCTQKAVACNPKFKDERFRYRSHEDLNDFLCSLGPDDGYIIPIILQPP